MKLKSLLANKKEIQGKTVFLRVDFNVSLEGRRIKENFKIKQALETINFLLENDCRLVLASHLGQPKNAYDAKLSLFPLAEELKLLSGNAVKFLDYKKYPEFIEIRQELKKNKKDNIFLLDNLRFFEGEEHNCIKLGKSLASLAQVYVNDAFAVSHRANSSVSAIKKFLPSYAGFLVKKEVENLNKILKPQKPFIAIMGGAKISTKIPIVKKIYPSADQILIGGALANNFFLAQGLNIGKSLATEKEAEIAKNYLKMTKIILPIDAVVKTVINSKKNIVSIKKINEILDNDIILDIGPKTISLFSKYISQAKTIVWNGPMGMFEEESFKKGTIEIAKKIATQSANKAFCAVGGGETVEALTLSGKSNKIDWVSTGGGAMLSYLSGEDMPGLN